MGPDIRTLKHRRLTELSILATHKTLPHTPSLTVERLCAFAYRPSWSMARMVLRFMGCM
jgi:hypothetical protein